MNIPSGHRFNTLNRPLMDETRAIQLCLKHRDPIGFEYLVTKYRREAFFHASTLLGNQEDALDACQDAFARAFAALPGLAALTEFYPWFYRILRNRCLNLLARRRTAERYQQAQHVAGDPGTDEAAAEPRAAMEQREEQHQVRAALARLRPDMREILTLKYLDQRSYDQIAQLLGIPRGTVMSRLYHARLALREAYIHSSPPLSHPQEVSHE
jgi:RNA polymerase sigma-70 factor, ECF subfamily